ncbi:hypothetical protein S40288_08327 [Stachybotrys chartarum IBT 40288]|nr:hypothetical protein S40288_08327 [Stachybotrys chartarum IBT 40288]
MAKRQRTLAAASRAIDPSLDALFASSAGPVEAPPISRYSELRKKAAVAKSKDEDEGSSVESQTGDDEEEDEDEVESDADSSVANDELDLEQDNQAEAEALAAAVEEEVPTDSKSERKRKRKRKDDNEDLEDKYLAELAKDGVAQPAEDTSKDATAENGQAKDNDESASEDEELVHESLAQESKPSDIEKAARTVFVANVSTEAISSKTAKKTLLNHLSSVLSKEVTQPEKIESIRFRSVAFSTGSMPKRAAYITKALMGATTKSTNAYVVYPTPAAARKAATELNGTEVLGRHIRVDSVAHPSPTDHRRCVFVGNLGFVDDETILNTNTEGEPAQKKRNKVPSDIEEGLWRTFGKQGKVENVRVIRDPKTRVGKGFAYVQFYDANDVEAALLLDEKKFPPMLPRKLRVTRAKDPRKTSLAQERSRAKSNAAGGATRDTKYKRKVTAEELSLAGRAGKLLGRAGAAQQRRASRGPRQHTAAAPGEIKTPEQIVFEGTRASANDRQAKRPRLGKDARNGRGARRATEWKKKKKQAT